MRTIWLFAGLLAVSVPASATLATVAAAQQAGTLASLPPALRAAALSGNSQAVAQAIATLSGGNPQTRATLANQVVRFALTLLSANPRNAVNLAAAAVNAVDNPGVQESAPSQTLDVLTTAARIIVTPQAQQVDPTGAGQIATAITKISSVPAVYQSNPKAAISVMDNAHTAATSQTVQAAMPQAARQIVVTLTTAEKSSALNGVNPDNQSSIARILGGHDQLAGNENDNHNGDLGMGNASLFNNVSPH
jgi:hypothetical protein